MKRPEEDIIPGLDKRLTLPYYDHEDKRVFTERHHLERGRCCGKTCRHCPYWPKYQSGNSRVREGIIRMVRAIEDRKL